jgi:hypothetical protein
MPNSNKSKYVELWRMYLPSIIQTMKNCNYDMRHMLLNPYEFLLIGNMKSFAFNLEYYDGKVSNNIKGSALARDLAAVFEESAEALLLIREGNFKIRMDKKFCLWICRRELNDVLILDFSQQLSSNL